MKIVFLTLFASVMAHAATDVYTCTTDTNKELKLEVDYQAVQSLVIDGEDVTDQASASVTRGFDGTVVTVRNFKNGDNLLLRMGRQIYQIGNGSERKMNCAVKRGGGSAKPDDGI